MQSALNKDIDSNAAASQISLRESDINQYEKNDESKQTLPSVYEESDDSDLHSSDKIDKGLYKEKTNKTEDHDTNESVHSLNQAQSNSNFE